MEPVALDKLLRDQVEDRDVPMAIMLLQRRARELMGPLRQIRKRPTDVAGIVSRASGHGARLFLDKRQWEKLERATREKEKQE
jgi:hypothetical protein